MEQDQEKKESTSKIFGDRFLKSYEFVKNEAFIPEMMTGLLYSAHEFSYAQIISNEINNRQGKNRKTYVGDSKKLMSYASEEDVNLIVDRQLDELMVSSLNVYLSDKQELPASEKFAAGIISRVKSMIVKLFGTGQYGIVTQLNLPDYVKPYVQLAFDKIAESKEDSLDDWINYLEDSGNDFLAEIVRSKGADFWGSDTVNAQDVFQRNFQAHLKEIRDYEKTYQMFLYYRNEYMKMTRKVTMNRLYETFDMTNNQYDKGLRMFINELPQMFNESEVNNLILKMIYEK